MNGQGKLLTHYLKNADKLIIPVYQRNYDWREEHCRKLYQDLVRTIRDRKRWHFFGGIVSVSDLMGSSSDYLVIDGQQRITTVSLLLLAMANLIKDGKVIPEDDNGLLDKGVSRFIAVLIASIIRLCSDSGGTGMSIAANSSNLRLSTVVTDFTSSLRMNGSKALIP